MKGSAQCSIAAALFAAASLAGCGVEGTSVGLMLSVDRPRADLTLEGGRARLAGTFDLLVSSSESNDHAIDLSLYSANVVSGDGSQIAEVVKVTPTSPFPLHLEPAGARRVSLSFVAQAVNPATDALAWLDEVAKQRFTSINGRIYISPYDEFVDIHTNGTNGPFPQLCLTYQGQALDCTVP